MDLECNSITRVVLPAIRINIAEEMKTKYGLNQQEIADKLGVAQVAVSKYLNGRYSGSVKRMKEYIRNRGLVGEVVKEVVKSKDPDTIGNIINRLCDMIASDNLVT